MTLILLLGAALGTPQKEVQARGLVGSWLCRYEATKEFYMMAETDYFHYLTRSKSAVAETGKVDGVLNKLLSVGGFDFVGTNEAILGREIKPSSISETTTEEANEEAPKVSAFDRFGVAGLTWSSYQGEWKYSYVDPCATSPNVSKTNYGAFYEGRQEPKSSYNEVSTSRDPRSLQFNRGFSATFFSALRDTAANWIFTIAKFVVTLTILFVGLAFTDITALMGLTDSGETVGSAAGMFSSLFNSFFTGFILFTFLGTALYILYNGLIKRQIRFALNSLIKTIAIFIVAIIISTDPAFWMSLPNKAATYGQALVLNSMSGMYETEPGYASLCTTEVASIMDGVNIENSANADSLRNEFEKTSQNMKSMIGCQLWEQFLFKPWVRGQFGVEYEALNSESLGNINSEWVGTAQVPLGNGEYAENWALFHLSTQTNAHAQVGGDNFPTYINGVNADWWRVADALSNYNEELVTEEIEGNTIENYVQVQSQPHTTWQSWIGNNSERAGTAFIAILFGIVGGVAPLLFGLMSAVFGLAITIMMITSPIFLLLGTWGGKGDQIFLGWLSALANLVVKRIATSFLLVFSISMTLMLMNMAYEIGFIKAFLLLLVVTTLLVKNRGRLLGMIAQVNFGGSFNPLNTAGQFINKRKQEAQQVGNIALATTAGAIEGRRTGQGVLKGARIGAANQLKNTLYQSQTGMHIMRELNLRIDLDEDRVCNVCLKKLSGENVIAYTDDENNYYCIDCADEMGTEDLYEVVLGRPEDMVEKEDPAEKTRTLIATSNRSYLSHSKTRELMDSKVINGKYYWNTPQVKSMIHDNIKRLREDILVFQNVKLSVGKVAKPPSIPEPLHKYIDLALINEAWTNGNIQFIEDTYKDAWKLWYTENALVVEGLNQDEIVKFIEEIEEISPEIDIQTTEELLAKNIPKQTKKAGKYGEPSKIYTYKKGQYTLEERRDKPEQNEE